MIYEFLANCTYVIEIYTFLKFLYLHSRGNMLNFRQEMCIILIKIVPNLSEGILDNKITQFCATVSMFAVHHSSHVPYKVLRTELSLYIIHVRSVKI